MDKFLELYSTYQSTGVRDSLFEFIQIFFKENFNYTESIVVSILTGDSTLSKIRVSWNQKGFDKFYKRSILKKLLKKVGLKRSLVDHKMNSEIYQCFYMGTFGQQKYYFIFKGQEELEWGLKVKKSFISFLKNSYQTYHHIEHLKSLSDLAHIDDVTGLFNQRKLIKDLEKCMASYHSRGEVFSLLFIDIDHFKSVNDGFGHLAGTYLLKCLGLTLKKTMRKSDLLYRYGGDEFVMLLPKIDGALAKKVARRILKKIKEETYQLENGKRYKLSVSIGISCFPADATTVKEILSIADRMMYQAKFYGRGQVCYAGDLFK